MSIKTPTPSLSFRTAAGGTKRPDTGLGRSTGLTAKAAGTRVCVQSAWSRSPEAGALSSLSSTYARLIARLAVPSWHGFAVCKGGGTRRDRPGPRRLLFQVIAADVLTHM